MFIIITRQRRRAISSSSPDDARSNHPHWVSQSSTYAFGSDPTPHPLSATDIAAPDGKRQNPRPEIAFESTRPEEPKFVHTHAMPLAALQLPRKSTWVTSLACASSSTRGSQGLPHASCSRLRVSARSAKRQSCCPSSGGRARGPTVCHEAQYRGCIQLLW